MASAGSPTLAMLMPSDDSSMLRDSAANMPRTPCGEGWDNMINTLT